MNTQSYLFENKESIPDGLYLELMNKLKLDFENVKPVKPKKKYLTKSQLIVIITENTREREESNEIIYDDRNQIMNSICCMNVKELRLYCKLRDLKYMSN